MLVRLARDAGRVVTREALMSDVWDMNWFGSTKTLDVHIAWLRRKLGDDPADADVHSHRSRGGVSGSPSRRRHGHKPQAPTARRARIRAAAGNRRARRPAGDQLERPRQSRGADPGAGAGGPGRRNSRRPARRRAARELTTLARTAATSVRGRVLDRQRDGRRAGGQRRARPGRRQLREPTGDRERARRDGRSRSSEPPGRSVRQILATAVPIIRNGRPVGAVRVTQSIAAVNSAVRRAELGLVLIGADRARARLARRGDASPPRWGGRSHGSNASPGGWREGRLGARAEVEGSREQRSLANSFNEMTERITRLLGAQREIRRRRLAPATHAAHGPAAAVGGGQGERW